MWLVRRNYGYNDYPELVNRFFSNCENYDINKDKALEKDSVVWKPRMDVNETEDAYNVIADLPGLDKKDINITLHDNVLTIEGERKSNVEKESKDRYYSERTYGNFSRSFSLPNKVKDSDIKARYRDGVLSVTVLKAEDAKPREIEIS